MEESRDLGGGDEVRHGKVLLVDPERERKNDFVPRVRISSVEKRGSLDEKEEGELGRDVEELGREETLREAGREVDWERGD